MNIYEQAGLTVEVSKRAPSGSIVPFILVILSKFTFQFGSLNALYTCHSLVSLYSAR